MDVDDGSGALVRRTGANDLGEQPGRLRPKTLPCIHEWQGYQLIDA
jgi:hypothetical protein